MDAFQQTHKELLLQILQIVDDSIQCKFVCKFWKSSVERAEKVTKIATIYTAKLAARGQLHLLKWARGLRYELSDHYLSWHGNVPMAAAKFGHFDISEWAMANGCQPPKDMMVRYYAKWGNTKLILKYAELNGADCGSYTYSDNEWSINYAAARHHRVDMFEWYDEQFGESSAAMEARCCGAVKSRDIPLLKELGKNKFLVGDQDMIYFPDVMDSILIASYNIRQSKQIWHQYATEINDTELLNMIAVIPWSG